MLLIKILIAHFLGDFVFQPDSWVKDKIKKKQKSKKLYLHILVHIGLMILVTLRLDIIATIMIIGVSHLIIDLCKILNQTEDNYRIAFFIDQILHVLVIVVLVNNIEPFLSSELITNNINQILLLVFSLILLTNVSSNVIRILISKWAPQNEDSDEDSLTDAGNYIGILERLFIFGFIITSNIQAVGFLLAAKSVFRFGDLKDSKDRKLTEYILIGTLISFGISMIIAFLYLKLKQIIPHN